MELNESQIDAINVMLGESAPVVVKKVVAKKVQKDEGEGEEDGAVDMKKIAQAIKVLSKVKEVLEKKEEEKLVAAVEKALEYLGVESEEKED
jgi:hypothetical protein